MKVYFEHLIANWKVAGRSFIIFLFHFMHGIIPVKFTEHEFWGLDGMGIAVKNTENGD